MIIVHQIDFYLTTSTKELRFEHFAILSPNLVIPSPPIELFLLKFKNNKFKIEKEYKKENQ